MLQKSDFFLCTTSKKKRMSICLISNTTHMLILFPYLFFYLLYIFLFVESITFVIYIYMMHKTIVFNNSGTLQYIVICMIVSFSLQISTATMRSKSFSFPHPSNANHLPHTQCT